MNSKIKILWLCILSHLAITINAGVYNILDYGAIGDGIFVNTDAINRAVKDAYHNGGGTILFPAGKYITGSVELRSNITIFLETGSIIYAAENSMNQYTHPDAVPASKKEWYSKYYQDWGHSTWKNSLFWGVDIMNVHFDGNGLINGEEMTSGDAIPGDGEKVIAFKNCVNISISNLKITKAGHFAVLLTGCDNIYLQNLLIDTNRDGINIDACKNVRVSNCIINSDDDGLCLKSSYALGYKRTTEDIVITNCILSGYKAGSVLSGEFIDEDPYYAHPDTKRGAIKRIGRIKFGTESNGGFRNISISNCVFRKCWGLAIESVDGAVIDNISISNITMEEIIDAPVFIRLGNRARGPEGTSPGIVRNIIISNLNASTNDDFLGSIISGIPDAFIENLTLTDINIRIPGNGIQSEINVSENERGGPEPTMFGGMPSCGFYFRNIKGLYLNNIKITMDNQDPRPALILQNVLNVRINGFIVNSDDVFARVFQKDKILMEAY